MISILLFVIFFLQLHLVQARSSLDTSPQTQLAREISEPTHIPRPQDINALSTVTLPATKRLSHRSTLADTSSQTTPLNLLLLLGTAAVLVSAVGTVLWKGRRGPSRISLDSHEMLPVSSGQAGSREGRSLNRSNGFGHRVRTLFSKGLSWIPSLANMRSKFYRTKITLVRWDQLLANSEEGCAQSSRTTPFVTPTKLYSNKGHCAKSSSHDTLSQPPQNDLLHEYPPLLPTNSSQRVSPENVPQDTIDCDPWDRSLELMEQGSFLLSPTAPLPSPNPSPNWASISSLSASPISPAFGIPHAEMPETSDYAEAHADLTATLLPNFLLVDKQAALTESNTSPSMDLPQLILSPSPDLKVSQDSAFHFNEDCHSTHEAERRLSTSTPTPQILCSRSENILLALDQEQRTPEPPANVKPTHDRISRENLATLLWISARIPLGQLQVESEEKQDSDSALSGDVVIVSNPDNPQGLLSPPPDVVSFTCQAQEYGRRTSTGSSESEAEDLAVLPHASDLDTRNAEFRPEAAKGSSSSPIGLGAGEPLSNSLFKVEPGPLEDACLEIVDIPDIDVPSPVLPSPLYDDPDYQELPDHKHTAEPGSHPSLVSNQPCRPHTSHFLGAETYSSPLPVSRILGPPPPSTEDLPETAPETVMPGTLLIPTPDTSPRDIVQTPTPPASPVANRAPLPVSRAPTPLASTEEPAADELERSPACSSRNLTRPAWSIRASDAHSLVLRSGSSSRRGEATGTPGGVVQSENQVVEKGRSLPGAFEDDTNGEHADNTIAPSSTPANSPLREDVTAANSTSILLRPDYPRHRLRSPLDIALAMQLRPALGIGADPAWMVRFLMAIFGWLTLMVGQQV